MNAVSVFSLSFCLVFDDRQEVEEAVRDRVVMLTLSKPDDVDVAMVVASKSTFTLL